MRKFVYFLVLGVWVCGCATYSHYENKHKEFEFHFAKRLFFNTYHLQIINHSHKRTIEFHGNSVGGDNYYVELNNGAKVSLDSKVFYYIGAKGRYWVNPSRVGFIPFEIKASVMQNAKEIVFKGITFIHRLEGHFSYRDDAREITIAVKIPSREIVVTEGELIPTSNDPKLLFDMIQNTPEPDLDKAPYDIRLRERTK